MASWYVSPLVVVLYFLSGFLALVHEVVWIRKLSLVFGVTSLAVTTVLEAAFSAYGEAIRLDPDYPEAHYNVGVAYTRQGRPAEALSAYREAIRIRPDFAHAHDGMGKIYAQMRSFNEARIAFRNAIKIDPNYADAYLDLALLFARSGDIDKAIETVGELLKRDPADRRARALHHRLQQLKKRSR